AYEVVRGVGVSGRCIRDRIKPEEDFVAEVSELAKYRKLLPDLENKWLEQLSPYGERGYLKKK
ncbi:hypothetical protein AMQ83_06085, partial [Paenibacillus riograndensis]